ncbi:hypothetical protein KUTeg_016060 [Tegillarca granosa]|uniref:Uncharacterized protein n=1 Tax=Tegillarca granosa TaxID=220873 RepID=A0ABQ9EPM1_TEGGR|nr:hypothetical protein KUTeg_016060 [Tegillarca granosa]
MDEMPYLGRDWRSPGDQWVRTREGWEKLKLWRVKVFENLNENILARLMRLAVLEWGCTKESGYFKHQPHIHFVKGISKERKVLTSLSEAFIHLDISGAAKDIRRFSYVSKLVEILLQNKLVNMSGTSQKYLFTILDEMVNQVLKSKINTERIKELLTFAVNSLKEGQHHHIGKKSRWESDVGGFTTGLYKFKRQLLTFLPQQISEDDSDDIDWKYIYKRCVLYDNNRVQVTTITETLAHATYKRFGKKEVFADMLAICSHCDTLFWQSIGHPCISEEEPLSKILSPDAFIKLFMI